MPATSLRLSDEAKKIKEELEKILQSLTKLLPKEVVVEFLDSKFNSSNLKELLPDEVFAKFEETKKELRISFKNDIENPINQVISENGTSNILSKISSLGLFFRENEEAEADLKQFRSDLEFFYRKVQLFYPTSKENLVGHVQWFLQRGRYEDLDLLHQVKTELPEKETEEIMFLLKQAQVEVCQRECRDLLAFFDLNTDQFILSIEKSIDFCQSIEHPAMREIYSAEQPTEVVDALKQIKELLERHKTPEEIHLWLDEPISDFNDLTPKQALLKGRTLPVLDFLNIIEERVYN